MIKSIRKGFSLAETLITLMIISLIMAATMPIVMKSTNAPSEAPWKYVTIGDLSQNAAVYTVLGGSSVSIFGDKRVPLDSNISANQAHVFASKMNPKISVVARNHSFNPLISRHLIDFYEQAASGTNVTNIGKISFDAYYNLAIGKNALDNIETTSVTNFSSFAANTLWTTLTNETDTNLKAALNTAVGQYAMGGDRKYLAYGGSSATEYPTRNMSGGANTALGAFSLRRNTTGDKNTAVGAYALESYNDTTPGQGSENNAIGMTALRYNNTGNDNNALGYQALYYNTSGNNNTAIGNTALWNNSTGHNNTAIGANAAGNINAHNKLYISANKDLVGTSALIYGDDTTGARKLIFNVTNKSAYLGSEATGTKIITQEEMQTYVTSYAQPVSDIRLKNVIGDNTAGLKEILQLKVKNYTMKKDKNKKLLVGVIAQDLQKIFPNSVIEGRDGYFRIKRDEIFYACVNAIKELHTMIQDVVAKIAGLDERIRLLEDRNKINEEKISALEKQNKMFEERLAALENGKLKTKIEKKLKPQTEEKNETKSEKTTETEATK